MAFRVTERELVVPSLYLMNKQPNGRISTSLLIDLLTRMMRPTGTDAESFTTDKILTSHKKLEI